MFDEEVDASQPNAQPQEPSIDDIPDIFDGSTMADASPETTVTGPSALDVGKFQRLPDTAPVGDPSMDAADIHEPNVIGRILVAIGILVVIVGVGGGLWLFKSGEGIDGLLNKFSSKTQTPEVKKVEPIVEAEPQEPEPEPTVATTTPLTPVDTGGNVDLNEKPLSPEEGKVVDIDVTTPVTPGPVLPTPTMPTQDTQLDTDKDGLTDVREAQLKTNPNNPDTDKDGLTDGSEVTIWKTDPLNPDTDGDTYPDGQELLNNFNPNGPGKLR